MNSHVLRASYSMVMDFLISYHFQDKLSWKVPTTTDLFLQLQLLMFTLVYNVLHPSPDCSPVCYYFNLSTFYGLKNECMNIYFSSFFVFDFFPFCCKIFSCMVLWFSDYIQVWTSKAGAVKKDLFHHRY
jgi:hypothetical protein